jgi:hypothetical protein
MVPYRGRPGSNNPTPSSHYDVSRAGDAADSVMLGRYLK